MENKNPRDSRAPYRPSQLPGVILAVVFVTTGAMNAAPLGRLIPRAGLRTLTTAHEAHNLTLEESKRAYPVRLRAVLTYYDPYLDSKKPGLFVHDPTGAIFVTLSSPLETPVRPGALIEIAGVSAAGDFAPIVHKASIRVVGDSHVPEEAPRVSLTQMLTGAYDGQWVEVEGVVHAVRQVGRNVNLDLAMGDGPITATALLQPGEDYSRLVDATIRIHANVGPVFNRRRQMTGVHLLFPGIGQIKIEGPAFGDPFSLPPLPLDQLMRYTSNLAFRHRIHVRGHVSLQWPGRSMCLQDASQGICFQTSQTTLLAEGEIADVVGFAAIGGLTPTLTDATFRSAGPGKREFPSPVTAEQALLGDHDDKLVQVSGRLIGKHRAAKDPTMVLSAGRVLFEVVLPERSWGRAIPDWEEGSILRVTGICSVQVAANEISREGFSTPAAVRVLLRSPEDVTVVQRPSWWTAEHLLPVLAVILAVILCVLGWVAVLRHRVAVQAKVIREQNAALRGLSFQDGLTGIANRRKFDAALEAEFARASRSVTSLSLLMVDIDYFKALNDHYGHQQGDECLVRVARALASVCRRPTDLVARYGGEEFGAILPGCGEAEAIALADRMRAAVLDLAIAHPGSPFSQRVSISVGTATIVPTSDVTPASLVAMADQALYSSKAEGRNKTTSSRAHRVYVPDEALVSA